ncbi:MAG: PAS domain-containing protein [Chlorobi bacterium]|nr:PAS domain-containing protein [Chlorobiota bacterium]
MDDWRKRIAESVQMYFSSPRGITRSRLELFLRQLESLIVAAGSRDAVPSPEAVEIIANLQTMTILLCRRPEDGEPVYLLREGRLAGELTTEQVYGKSPRELFPPEVNAVTTPMVEQAFAGNDVEFTYTLGERTFLTLLHPFRRNEQGEVVEVLGSMVDVTNERRYANELEHSERLFRTLVENMPCGILYEETYADGTLSRVIVNSEFTRLTGYTGEQYVLTPIGEWNQRTHPEDREQVWRLYCQWLESNTTEPLHLQYRFFDRHDVPRWLDNYVTRIFHEDGTDGVLQVVLDITERALTEQRLRHAASYLEQSIEPIIECDQDYRVTFFNRAAAEAFPQLNIGCNLTTHSIGADLAAPSEQVESDQQTSMVQAGEHSYLRRVTRTDTGWRLFCHDVTPLVEAEYTLRRALEREQSLNALRSQFISTLSHEFRTPLAGILTSAQLLDRYGNVMSDEQRKEAIASIVARVRDLEHIVHSFTRRSVLLGRTGTRFSHIELQSFIGQLAQQVEIIRRRRAQLVVACDCLVPVVADAELLTVVLEALLDNAARYGPDEGIITVSVRCENDRFFISVLDSGIGIPHDEMDRLFTPYFRSSRAGNIPGSGLSLATLKPLIEAAGGVLSLDNRPEGGMIAIVELPCTEPTSQVEHPKHSPHDVKANNSTY